MPAQPEPIEVQVLGQDLAEHRGRPGKVATVVCAVMIGVCDVVLAMMLQCPNESFDMSGVEDIALVGVCDVFTVGAPQRRLGDVRQTRVGGHGHGDDATAVPVCAECVDQFGRYPSALLVGER